MLNMGKKVRPTFLSLNFPIQMLIRTCLILSVVNHCEAFRIAKTVGADVDHVISGKEFQVETLDKTTAVKWTVPYPCNVQNNSASVTSVICAEAGYYGISAVTETEKGTQFVQVRESPLCYTWYIRTLNNRSNDSADHKVWYFQVWVVDTQHATEDEMLWQVKQPSESSKVVSQGMFRRGQVPTLQQKRRHRNQNIHSQLATFDADNSLWLIEVYIQFEYEILLLVTAKPEVAVNGCFVRDTSFILTLPKFHNILQLPFIGIDIEKLQGDPGRLPQLIQDPCVPSVALLLQSDTVWLTQDNFKKSTNLYLPKQVMLDYSLSSSVVQRAAFTPTDLLLLIDGTIVNMDKNTGEFKAVPGLPPASMISLKGRNHCMPTTKEQLNIIRAVVWGDNSQDFYLYFRSEHTLSTTFKKVKMSMELLQPLGFTDGANVDIHDIAFDCPSGRVGILANVSQHTSHAVVILVYNTVTTEWTNLPYWIDDEQNGRYSIMFLNAAESAFVFWSSTQIHYSYQDGVDVGTMEVSSCNTTVLGSSPGDIIQQVAVSIHGEIIVLMYPSNTIYYTRRRQRHLIELPASELPSVKQLVFFDSLGRLKSLTGNSSLIQLYPLALHVAGSVYPQVCKYHHFDHNGTADVYYLDLGRQLSLSASLTYPLYYFNTIQVLSSSENLLRQQTVDRFQYYQSWQTLNKTVIIESSANLYGADNYTEQKKASMADVLFEMKPQITDISCKLPDSMTVRVSLGCPPGRRLQVHKPAECQMPSNYTIPRSTMQDADGNIPASNKEVQYNMDIGCPVVNHYKDTFLPAIDLYDGDIFIEEMTASYIMWEIHGRSDYSYTANMEQAGCQSAAQTWQKMNGGQEMTSGLWGPHNYRHCFSENMTTPSGNDLLQPYEILNSTGLNRITWDTWRNDSIYQFTVLVIDPQYSFCHLEASFGVRLIGLIPSRTPTSIIMRLSIGLFAMLTLSLAIVSYLIFRRRHIEEYELYLAHSDDDDEHSPNDHGDTGGPSTDIFKMLRRRHKSGD